MIVGKTQIEREGEVAIVTIASVEAVCMSEEEGAREKEHSNTNHRERPW